MASKHGRIPSENHPSNFQLRIWLECRDGFTLGPGKAELLRGIETHGSLNKAAAALGMSYRKAWGRIKKAEQTLGQPVVTKVGGNKSGYRLTPFATELVRGYEAWVAAVTSYCQKKAAECIPSELLASCPPPQNSDTKKT